MPNGHYPEEEYGLPVTPTPVEGGFRWPWQTPPGEGFVAPWTPQESYIDPTTGQMIYRPKPPVPEEPMAPMQPQGPDYGPYLDPGQIPPELLELYDWEPYTERYWVPAKVVDGVEQPAHYEEITMYQLIPKAQMTPYQQWQISQQAAGATGYPLPSGQAQTTWDDSGMEWFWNEYSGRYEQSGRYNQAYDMRLQQAGAATPGGMSAYEEDYLRLQRERLAAEQGWRQQELGLEQQQYAAQLAAQPKSWLEYAAFTGQPPAVQPWMLPLMPQEYAGLGAGQLIPGWQAGTPTGGYEPWTTPPPGTQPTTGYGGTPSGTPTVTTGWRPQTVDEYIARGLSPSEAERAAEYDRLHAVWRSATPGPEKATAFLTKGQYAAEKPETIERYQQALGAVESGAPLLGSLGTSGKFDLVEQLIRQGMDRTLAERQVFGGSRTFAPYTPISDISGVAPPTTPYAPTTMPIEEREPTPKRKPTPSYTPSQIPMEESMGNVPAYIPGMSWHEVDPQGIGSKMEGSNWFDRLRGLGTSQIEGEPATGRVTGLWLKPGQQYGGQVGLAPGEPAPPTQETFGRLQPTTGGRVGRPTLGGLQQAPSAAGHFLGYRPDLPMGGMPALTRPSRQYQARMGPTALQQYYGYGQARTGITPEEMQFRLWSMAPPGGGYSGLRYMR